MVPSAAGASRRLSRSFRDVLDGGASPAGGIEYLVGDMEGVPALFISDEDSRSLAKPFELTLIGKFASPCPPLSVLRSFTSRLKFSGGVRVHRHDDLNAIFCFSVEHDYTRFFSHHYYTVFGMPMKVVKWSPFSDVSVELPIVPLWLSFPGLRFQFFDKRTLMFVGGLFGKPLGVDSATVSLGNLAHARVLVEIDASKPIPSKVWIGSRISGYYQKVVVENRPPFCDRCLIVGHSSVSCAGRAPPPASPSSVGLAASPRSPHRDLAVVCYHPHELMVSGQGRGPSQSGGGGSSPRGEDDGGLSVSGDPPFSYVIDSASLPACGDVAGLDQSYGGDLPVVGFTLGAPSFVDSVGSNPRVDERFNGGMIPEIVGEIVMHSDPWVNLVGKSDAGAGVQLDVPAATYQVVMPAGEDSGSPMLVDVPVLEVGRACDDPGMSASDDAGSQPFSPSCSSFPVRGITTRSMTKAGSAVQSGRRGGEASGKRKNKMKNKRKTKYDSAMAIALEALFRPPNYEK